MDRGGRRSKNRPRKRGRKRGNPTVPAIAETQPATETQEAHKPVDKLSKGEVQ